MDTKVFFHYPNEPDEQAPSAGFLEDASGAEMSKLLAFAQARHLRRDETVYTEGDRDAALYVLTIGAVELRSSRAPTVVLGPPATIGEIAFLDGGPSLESCKATTDSELLRLSQDAFEALSAREPELARKIVLDLARKLAAVSRARR